MIYGVFYYNGGQSNVSVKLAGFYLTQEEAVERLQTIIPEYKNYINNTVNNSYSVGWINTYQFGDYNSDSPVCQPFNAVKLF